MCCFSKRVMQKGAISICCVAKQENVFFTYSTRCGHPIKYTYVCVHVNEANYLWKQAII